MSVSKTLSFFLILLVVVSVYTFGQNLAFPTNVALRAHPALEPRNFIDGETVIAEILFTGLDPAYGGLDDDIVQPARLPDLLSVLRKNQASIDINDKFDSRKTEKVIRLTKKFLADLSYLDARVVALGEELSTERMRLIFSIDKGSLSGISRFVFTGTRSLTSEELQAALVSCLGDDWRASDWSKTQFCIDRGVRTHMFSKGFAKATINKITRKFTDRGIEIIVNVSEGQIHRYGDLTIKGATVFTPKEILELFGHTAGDIVNGKELQEFAYEKLPRLYCDGGYMQFNDEFKPVFLESTDGYSDPIVDVEFTFEEGRRFRIASVDFTGLSKDDVRELKNNFPIKAGDFYNKTKLEDAYKKLVESGEYKYFDPERDIELLVSEERLDVEVVIKLPKREP